VVLCEFFGLSVPFIYFCPKKGRISEGKKLRTEGFIGWIPRPSPEEPLT
jgi:hypothetical protein